LMKTERALLSPSLAGLAFMCAVETEEWALAGQLEQAARSMLKEIDHARSLNPEVIRINDISGVALRDHRRIRLPAPSFDNSSNRLIVPDVCLNLERKTTNSNVYETSWELPVKLPPGHYRLNFSLLLPPYTPAEEKWKIQMSDNLCTQDQTLVVSAQKSLFTHQIAVDYESTVSLNFRCMDGSVGLKAADVEIRWGGEDLFANEKRLLEEALMVHESPKIGNRNGSNSVGPVFYPWLRLVDVRDEPLGGRKKCVFKVLRCGLPLLNITLWNNPSAIGCPYLTAPLNAKTSLKDESIEVFLPVPKPASSGMWIRVESAEQWFPGALEVMDSHETLLKL
jgi:hypothetical protein